MAKSLKRSGANKMMRQRTVLPKGAKDAGQQQYPLKGVPSNESADKQARMIFIGTLILSGATLVAGVFWCVAFALAGYHTFPINWLQIIAGAVGIGVLVFIGRAFIWLSIFAALMFAQKNGAWEAQKFLSERAMRLKKIIPGGATTAALLLVQGYISRGELDETIKIGQRQYEDFGKDPRQQQNLAPIYSTLGLAFYMQSAWRESITWNDRAVEAFNQLIDQFQNKKGWMAKLAGPQSGEMVKNMHTSLAVAHFNNGTNHFQLRNYQAAKSHYRSAIEHANKSPDFPDKDNLLKVSKEQMQRLKHS